MSGTDTMPPSMASACWNPMISATPQGRSWFKVKNGGSLPGLEKHVRGVHSQPISRGGAGSMGSSGCPRSLSIPMTQIDAVAVDGLVDLEVFHRYTCYGAP